MNKHLEEIVRGVAGRLSEAGFKRSGINVRKAIEIGYLTFNFQSSVKSDDTRLIFTANFLVNDKAVGKWLSHNGYCDSEKFQFRERLGKYKCGTDYWWDWSLSEDPDLAVKDVSETISYALSVESDIISDRGLIGLWERGYSPGLTSFMRQVCMIAYYESRGDVQNLAHLNYCISQNDESIAERNILIREATAAVTRIGS